VIDESGAAQMLLPESRRKRPSASRRSNHISTMARIPPKTVSKDDAEVLRHLEQTLKTTVYGQDKAIEALSSSIKLARAGLREPKSRSLLPVLRPDRRRQDEVASNWPRRSESN